MTKGRMSTPSPNRDRAIAATRMVVVPDILDVHDLAFWLRCRESFARAQLRSGRIPGSRVGRRWFVTREALLRALTSDDAHRAGGSHLPRVVRDADAES